MSQNRLSLALTFLALGACLTGCGKSAVESTPNSAVTEAVDDHSGWWCAEHGVPEEVCGLCSPTVAADLKAKGDWCAKHDCPDSQCFVCHPEFAEKFAAQYEAKYGKAPPPRSEG